MNAAGKLVSLTAAIIAVVALPAILAAQSEKRVEFGPGLPLSGPPIYAQISYTATTGWEIYHNDEWAAIPFYRDPRCVPPDFSLLDMFDIPGAFYCTLMVHGFEIKAAEGPPIKMKTWGLGAVPIYFIKWSELQEAIVDRNLTITELKGLVSKGPEFAMVGTASYFECELHPSGGTAVPHIAIVAFGRLPDQRRFQFQVAGGDQTELIQHIKIAFQ